MMLDSLKKNEDFIPSLLLHSCCGPCSSHVIMLLNKYFNITIYYYNPNIEPKEEYDLRKKEQIRLINEIKCNNSITFLDCDYNNNDYQEIITGLENELEGGIRCHNCFNLRLKNTALMAKKMQFDYFGTTLSVSPHKDSQILNKIGFDLQEKHSILFLPSDFKKEEGYKKSIELAKQYGLYRQDYCGCRFSKRELVC